MPTHYNEEALEYIWNDFSDDDKTWIGRHCNGSDLAGYGWDEAADYMTSSSGNMQNMFRNAIIYVSSGYKGELYVEKDGEYVNNLYSPE